MAQTDKETVDISVDDLSGSVSTSAYEDYIGINSWLDGYLYALAGREKNTIKLLASCPEKELRTGDSSADDFFYSYIEFLKSVTSPDAEVLLNKVFVQCKTAKIAPRELIDHLILPQLELWKAILTKSVTDFNQKLEAAVIKHHAYWSQKVELGHQSYRCNSPDSLLAMRLAGIASFAHDHGIEVNYRSEYLPEFIIQNYLTVDAKVRFPEE